MIKLINNYIDNIIMITMQLLILHLTLLSSVVIAAANINDVCCPCAYIYHKFNLQERINNHCNIECCTLLTPIGYICDCVSVTKNINECQRFHELMCLNKKDLPQYSTNNNQVTTLTQQLPPPVQKRPPGNPANPANINVYNQEHSVSSSLFQTAAAQPNINSFTQGIINSQNLIYNSFFQHNSEQLLQPTTIAPPQRTVVYIKNDNGNNQQSPQVNYNNLQESLASQHPQPQPQPQQLSLPIDQNVSPTQQQSQFLSSGGNTMTMTMKIQTNRYPWMVAILQKSIYHNYEFSEYYLCDGTIISQGIVLTAAHCVGIIDPNKLKVRAGQLNTKDINLYQERKIRKIIKHNKYNENDLHNYDIALIFLRDIFELNTNIQLMILASGNDYYNSNNCTTIYWNNEKQIYEKSNQLLIITNPECESILRNTNLLNPNYAISPTDLCINGLSKNTCQHIGGSPLVCIRNNQYTQLGILSKKITCDQRYQIPEMYTKITELVGWIQNATDES